MSHSIFLPNQNSPRRGVAWLATVLAVGMFVALLAWMVYVQFLIDVGTGQVGILIRKTGKDIQNSDEIAPDSEHKGVQKDLLTEGRHWQNPF